MVEIGKNMAEYVKDCEQRLSEEFNKIDEIAFINQNKVLNAFKESRIALRHFAGTTGYGYDDVGRDGLCKVFATAFNAEDCIVSPNIVSGTHAITLALFGILRPNDTALSISGSPYDTLNDVIFGEGNGSLKDFSINFDKIELLNGEFDYVAIKKYLSEKKPKMIFIQRSRGYEWRSALKISQIAEAIGFIKQTNKDIIICVDNCYGEFTDILEPTDAGADIMVGSLIKNPGGGLAATGGYIAGKAALIQLIAYRLTAPSIGMEVGSYANGYQYFYQGFFQAPHCVAQAIKGAKLFSIAMEGMGFEVMPKYNDAFNDIVCSVKFNNAEQLIKFCQGIQSVSPVDSFVTPLPWDMPGYNDQVIMAAGCFVQGASIELSCDSPIKPPYIAYVQGGLTYEHIKIAVLHCLSDIKA